MLAVQGRERMVLEEVAGAELAGISLGGHWLEEELAAHGAATVDDVRFVLGEQGYRRVELWHRPGRRVEWWRSEGQGHAVVIVILGRYCLVGSPPGGW